MVAVARVEPHSISHGTMREEDLIPAFLAELRLLDPERAEEMFGELQNDLCTPGLSASVHDISAEFLTELFDVLEEYAPEDLYFGAHAGDGSDYGFWALEETAEEVA